MKPLLAVVITTYNRPDYLGELLSSLSAQRDSAPVEVVVFDNGSAPAVSRDVLRCLETVATAVHLVREESNAISGQRLMTAARLTSAEYILVPGDDDILKPDYLQIMSNLAISQPRPMLLSAAAETIDENGRELGGRLIPTVFSDQPTALASILSQATYAMPASGFHRSLLEAVDLPRTRSSVDWWIWLQCWLRGPAAVTTAVAVQYRVHAGQEQHQYGLEGKSLDAARMLLAFVTGDGFRTVIRSWTAEQHEQFIETVLRGRGPSWGEPRWSGLIQAVLADVLAETAPTAAVLRLFADGAARAGVIAPPGMLNTLVDACTATSLANSTWLHVPVRWVWETNCAPAESWRLFLECSDGPSPEFTIAFGCPCSHAGSHHALTATLRSADGADVVSLPDLPGESAAAPLLDAIGRHVGRPGSIAQPIGVEEKALKLIRRLRRSKTANRFVSLARRRGWQIS